MKKFLTFLIACSSMQAAADMSCAEYEKSLRAADSWITCRVFDKFSSTDSSSIIAETYVSPEGPGKQRVSASYYTVTGGNDVTTGMTRVTGVEIASGIFSDSNIQMRLPAPARETLGLLAATTARKPGTDTIYDIGSFVSNNSRDVILQHPVVHPRSGKVVWTTQNNGRFSYECEYKTPVEFELLLVGSDEVGVCDGAGNERDCQPFVAWKHHRTLIAKPTTPENRMYFKEMPDGSVACLIRN